jgi:hypothetical protein
MNCKGLPTSERQVLHDGKLRGDRALMPMTFHSRRAERAAESRSGLRANRRYDIAVRSGCHAFSGASMCAAEKQRTLTLNWWDRVADGVDVMVLMKLERKLARGAGKRHILVAEGLVRPLWC